VSPIAHSSALKTSIRPVPRHMRRDLHWVPCLHTAAAPIRPSVHHIQAPAPILASFSLPQRCAALLAAVLSSSMVVLTTDSSPGGGHSVPSVVRPCSCSSLITLHIGALEEGLWCKLPW
jgi:hypothetical protein